LSLRIDHSIQEFDMTDRKIALVSGANRGIGLEIARQLASMNILVLLGSRDLSKGKIASKSIKGAEKDSVEPIKLDVSDFVNIESVGKTVKDEFGRLDILVNNAGVLLDNTDYPSKTDLEIARKTFETNVLGAWKLCQVFTPMMKKKNYGRIVNMSSGAGRLASLEEDLYSPAYSLAKASLNALTIMLSREVKGSNVLINSMSPGWVRTDMGGSNAPRSVEQGADTAVWLATLPDGGPSGGFFEDRKRIDW
jgi:NAD(P)-dependent dehydrogenase (short-subunit alcohol dehydrogenase family)